MKDYSQNNEQKIILDYFGDFKGVVLDIGANDGIFLSNSRALIELQWKAVLVEPSPAAFERLRVNNTWLKTSGLDKAFSGTAQDFSNTMAGSLTLDKDRVQCINAAITTSDGPIDLYDSGTHLKKGDVALLSTTVPKEMDRWKKSGEVFTKTTVRGITFNTLLQECGLILSSVIDYTDKIPDNVARFDFISIDAEGMDYEILKQIDLTAVGCRLLCVEVNNGADSHFTQYAAKHGMRLLHKNYENRLYCK